MTNDSFLTRHLREADEGYFEHMGFALKAGAKLLYAGLAVMIHALIPCVFIKTGSSVICALYQDMQARKAACEERRKDNV